MGLADNFKNMAQQIQMTTKNTTVSFTQKMMRLVSGFFIGLVLGLIIQELTHSGSLVLTFLTILITATIYKLLARFNLFQILIFDLICVLVATLLRMYIMIAP